MCAPGASATLEDPAADHNSLTGGGIGTLDRSPYTGPDQLGGCRVRNLKTGGEMKIIFAAAVSVLVLSMGPFDALSQVRNAAPLTLTPRQTEGPYYPIEKLADRDNDLTRVGNGAPAQGEILSLSGRLVDQLDRPVSSVRIEIWQADHRGIYMHPSDSGSKNRDPNFQSYGEATTDEAGAFRFRTVMPGIYGSRPRHIHVKIVPVRGSSLTTQVYFKGDERLASDGIVRRLGSDIAALLLDAKPLRQNEQSAEITFVVRQD